jgi:hypothetical protein
MVRIISIVSSKKDPTLKQNDSSSSCQTFSEAIAKSPASIANSAPPSPGHIEPCLRCDARCIDNLSAPVYVVSRLSPKRIVHTLSSAGESLVETSVNGGSDLVWARTRRMQFSSSFSHLRTFRNHCLFRNVGVPSFQYSFLPLLLLSSSFFSSSTFS